MLPSRRAVVTSAPASLLDLIGNTPLLQLNNLVENPRVEIYGKAEWANPGGSVKDRPALNMILAGERTGMLRAYGAELVFTDPMSGTDGAIIETRRIVVENPDAYFYPDQYNNPANWQAHYETTGVEIFEQTEGRITHFVAGLGTSGTFIGVARRLRELKPDVRLISMQPDSPYHGLEGMKH